MHPEVSFAKGKFVWVITDIVSGGTYTCRLGKIVAYDYPNSAEIEVRLDRLTGRLWWKGKEYLRVER
jgi:hypothetical protein